MFVFVMLDFVYVTFFKCLVTLFYCIFCIYKVNAYICYSQRKGQVMGVTSVVLTLVFQIKVMTL